MNMNIVKLFEHIQNDSLAFWQRERERESSSMLTYLYDADVFNASRCRTKRPSKVASSVVIVTSPICPSMEGDARICWAFADNWE